MAQQDNLKRYLDAGVAFSQMTRERAEAIVKDLVKAGEVRRKDAERRIDELVDRSRENSEQLVAVVRREFDEQLEVLRAEVSRLEARLRGDAPPARSSSAKPGATGGTPAKVTSKTTTRPAAKKAPASQKPATAVKASVAKAPATKTATKAPVTAKKASSTSASAPAKAAKKAPAKKAPAKKATKASGPAR